MYQMWHPKISRKGQDLTQTLTGTWGRVCCELPATSGWRRRPAARSSGRRSGAPSLARGPAIFSSPHTTWGRGALRNSSCRYHHRTVIFYVILNTGKNAWNIELLVLARQQMRCIPLVNTTMCTKTNEKWAIGHHKQLYLFPSDKVARSKEGLRSCSFEYWRLLFLPVPARKREQLNISSAYSKSRKVIWYVIRAVPVTQL